MDHTQVRDLLIAAGIDYDTALRRMMGKESLYYRFLKKFLDDENYVLLLEAAGQGDSGAAFRAAHTLKGVCGNLGMDRLFGAVTAAEVAEALKQDMGIEVDKKKIALSGGIKELGTYDVAVKVYAEVSATIKVDVVRA